MPSATRTFSYDEAQAMLPMVRGLTESALRQISALYARVQSQEELDRRREEIDGAVEQIVEAWAAEVSALGCEVKGLWLVDWDSGHGYYCWRYPEESIAHFHGYDDGFAGRIPIN